MKTLTLVCLVLMLTSCLSVTTVQPSSVTCTCAQIQYQPDCQAATTQVNGTTVQCAWTANANATGTAAKGTCAAPTTTTPVVTATPTYCTSIAIASCPSTLGCATTDGKTCSPFTGCSAYIKTTDALCQAVSTQCTTDGTQCSQKAACSTYSVALCGNSASSGSGICKVVNNACVDQVCSDVTSQTVCTGFTGCVWNGVTCATSLTACASTAGTATTCPLITGSDGPCKFVSGTNCTVKTCADAPATTTTDANCKTFLSSCPLTNGKGCVAQLPLCSTYLQTNTCAGYIGSDGPCVTDTTSTTACRAQLCSDAATSVNTDTGCASFKSGCVSTGQGCTSSRGPCSGYQGTTSTCVNFIGSDGNCKGTSATTPAACVVKVCADNTTATSDSACNAFQSGCKTNGRGCVPSLVACSNYTVAANAPCDGLIGSDGNCTAPTGSGTTCVARVCTAATTNTTTNAGCQAFSPNCVTNGTTCIQFTGTCEAQTTAIQCQGSSTCQSTSVCNDNTTCANYLTQSMCLLNKAGPPGFPRTCTWSSSCTDTTCVSLTGSTYVNDSACNNGAFGCVFSGAAAGGCVEPTAGCAAFTGTNATSSVCATAMKGTCWGQTASVGACAPRTCALYSGTTPTTDGLCSTFLSTCVSDGANACITAGACGVYFGSAASCKAITNNTDRGLISRNLCWPNVSSTQTSGACRVMACSDIIIGTTSFPAVASSACSSVNPNCTTSFNSGSGSQCVLFAAACSSYSASFNNCKTALTTTTGQTCSKYAKLCGYQAPQACASYTVVGTDTITNQVYCQGVSVDGTVLCGYTTGTNCVALSSVTTCTGFAVASSTATTNFAYCQKMKSSGTTQCGYTTGSTTCSTVACSQVTPTAAADCTGIVGTTCAYSFNTTASCIAVVASCAYTIPGGLSTQSAKLAWCNAIRDSTATAGCGYSSGTTCSTAKACTDLNTNSYTGTLTQGVCNTYMAAPACAFSGFSCQAKTGTLPVCTLHVFPTGVTLTNQQKFQFCNALSEDATKFCSWDGTAANCISASGLACTGYTVTSGAANILANQAYCSSLKDQAGVVCSYDGTGAQGTCGLGALSKTASAGCVSYVTVVSGTANDVANQLYCTKLSETDGTAKPCAYSTGSTTCTSQGATACTAASYTPVAVATTEAQRLQICQSEGCGFAFTGTSATSTAVCLAAKACTDLTGGITSLAQCENYVPGGTCGFNAVLGSCYILATACSALPNQNSLAKCAGFADKDAAGFNCGQLSTLAGTSGACKTRVCGDITNAASATDCSGYLSSCIYDGTTTCKSKGACNTYTYAQGSATQKAFCEALVNASGQQCTNNPAATSTACVERSSSDGCQNSPAAAKPLDCQSWGAQCLVDTSNACAAQACSEITNATSNVSCPAQCIWNGTTGCVLPTVTCSTFTGTDATCRNFTGNNIQCYQSNAAATATTPCADLSSCTLNTTATSDAQCESFWPSPKGQTANYRCQWNGTTGCVTGRSLTCSNFNGTIDSCPKFTGATDQPCKGASSASAACAPTVCTDAPNTATTDALCSAFRTGCITTGAGCQSPPVSTGNTSCQNYQNQASCTASKLGGSGNTAYNTCGWTSACVTGLTSCTSATSAAACVITSVTKNATNPLGTCSWYINSGTGACRATTCADLAATNTQDSQCSALIPTCTTSGAGCVTKAACSTYLNNLACTSAATTDTITKCTWVTGSGCRMQQCQDNNFTTDAACNVNGLKTCRTTGTTCIAASNLSCSNFLSAPVCLKDGNNNPCLWINGICQSYTGCNSISWTTHAQCQLILTGATTPQCTSDGSKCQPLNSCSNYKAITTSCVVGNDASTCGMLPANSNGNTSNACQKFGACGDAKGATNSVCQAYGSSCISNGTICQVKSNCASYTQVACANLGTDGACFWSTSSNACRTQQCGDATTNNTTDAGCAAFPAPYINACTTNGTGCVSRSTCASYTVSAGCVLGTDGACFWVAAVAPATGGSCRVKQCGDVTSTTTPGCQNNIISSPATTSSTGTTNAKYLQCVSNGTVCIAQANCATYTNLASCSGNGYGLDGNCAFTPANATSPTVGTCKLVTQCTDAGVDSIACGIASDRCQFKATVSGTTTTSSCIAQDCVSKASGSTCQPVPSWDRTTYTLCLPVSATNSTCQNADGSGFIASTCFSGSLKTYTWNDTSLACQYCGTTTTTPNNTNNGTTNGTTYGSVITSSFLVFGALLAVY